MNLGEVLQNLWESTGLYTLTQDGQWKCLIMLVLACFLIYLAIVKKYEPLLLLPIAFGMLLINIPGAYGVLYQHPTPEGGIGGLFYYIYKGVELVIFPPLIFLGIGAMTDFGPLLSNPKSLILGAAAQFGIFFTLICGMSIFGFDDKLASAVAIIGGADGPTAIYLSSLMLPDRPEKVAAIAIAAYSYMALIPIIQPPIMKALTTQKERLIRMDALKPVSKLHKIIFPIAVIIVCGILLPSALPLLGMLMFGNILRESGVTERLSKTAQNELTNIVTILLGIVVGTKAYGPNFLDLDTLFIVVLGLVAFCGGTASGVLIAKLMNLFSKKKINPLIGAAGVSAVPMAARVAQDVGSKEDPTNFLLMHAMGPNVAGVIGSAVAAGVLIAIFL